MICFESFLEKNTKGAKTGNWAFRAPWPQRRAPSPRRSPTPQRGLPHRGKVKGPESCPPASLRRSLATTQRSSATLQHRHCSHEPFFDFFVSEHLVFVHRLFRNPIK